MGLAPVLPEELLMLSDTARSLVQVTLPLVGENIQTIAQRFYQHLFDEHPQLMDGVFNRGNQADGSQQQALAGAVATFASALVHHPDELPERLLLRVAHKHASLGIRPDQYRIVHDTLMWAVQDVLGDAVTPQAASAWSEVYWLMAYALIHLERGLYSAHGVTPEAMWREWEVTQVIPETDDVVTFVVQGTDDRLAKASLPGQYVTVLVPVPDGLHQPRQYSLTRADDGRHRQFSVKRVRGDGGPDGEVSTVLCTCVRVGDRLTLSPPYGDVVLDDSGRPVVLASAGIGIAPMAGMLSHLVASGSRREVTVLHADVEESSFALRRQIDRDIAALPGASLHVWYEKGAAQGTDDRALSGWMDLSKVALPQDACYYVCGPLGFLRAIRGDVLARGVPARDVRYEVFGPDLWQADAQTA